MKLIQLILISLLPIFVLKAGMPNTASYEELQKLTESSGRHALDGNLMVIGAPDEDVEDQTQAGAAYVYERNNNTGLFTQIVRLVASDALAEDHFGYAVAVSNDTIVISSQGSFYGFNSSTADAGAYVFEKNNVTGVFEQTIKLIDTAEYKNQHFGKRLAIDGDILIVGDSNQLHIYERNAGTGLFEPMGNNIYAGYNNFDLDNNVIVISLPNEGPDGDDWPKIGVVDVYKLNFDSGFFDLINRLTLQDPMSEEKFGISLAINNDTIAIGEASDYYFGVTGGALYIFQFNSISGNYEQTDKLTTGASELSNDYLGKSVDIYENRLITGGSDVDNNSTVYIFERNSTSEPFEQTVKLNNSNSSFGRDVSISNNSATVGSSSGVYVYGDDSEITSMVPVIMYLLN